MNSESEKNMSESVVFSKEIRKICEMYLEAFPQEVERLRRLMDLTKKRDIDLRSRSTIPDGHICASGIIISQDRKNFLILKHKSIGIWVVPGGHYDTEDDLIEKSALREASEETGIDELIIDNWHEVRGIPIDIDTHYIPTNPSKNELEHVHFDFRYVLRTSFDQKIKLDSNESLDYKWLPIEKIDQTWSISPAIKKLPLIFK